VRRLHPAGSPASADRARVFSETLAQARGKHVLVALRGHPDPDGIASALAFGHLASRQGVRTTISYCHELSHRENRALVKLLGLELRRLKSVKEVAPVDYLALVDAYDVDPDLADAEGLEVLAIVDHHRTPTMPTARFVDLRPDVGATAAIFVEYIDQLAPLDPENEDERRIATALMLGLSTDTDDFMLARAGDFRAASQIAEACDRELLADLSRRLIAPSAMDVIARALSSLVVRRNFASAGVGFVQEGDRDTIAQAADFLVRREDIDTVVVYGVVGDKSIEGSLRTHSPSVDPAAWLEQAFGHDDKGRAFGGGRRDKGGFRIPIGFLGRSTDRAQLWTLVEHSMRTALARMIGEDAQTGVHAPVPAIPPERGNPGT
ncbi:MAG: DHH family phosphoesterase, partial [Polyangiaceae bacterium]